MSAVAAHRLRVFHALLEKSLREEQSRPRPDDRKIAGLKKRKLAIRDRLLAFSSPTMRPATA